MGQAETTTPTRMIGWRATRSSRSATAQRAAAPDRGNGSPSRLRIRQIWISVGPRLDCRRWMCFCSISDTADTVHRLRPQFRSRRPRYRIRGRFEQTWNSTPIAGRRSPELAQRKLTVLTLEPAFSFHLGAVSAVRGEVPHGVGQPLGLGAPPQGTALHHGAGHELSCTTVSMW